jgi:hypothetical protein
MEFMNKKLVLYQEGKIPIEDNEIKDKVIQLYQMKKNMEKREKFSSSLGKQRSFENIERKLKLNEFYKKQSQ